MNCPASSEPSPSSSKPSRNQKLQMEAIDIVENAIAENDVVIFSKSYCPYCRKAKALFKAVFPDLEPKIFEINEMEEGKDIQDYLKKKTGQKTVPNIFINKKHIGGSDAVIFLHKSGKLVDLVNGQDDESSRL